MGMSASQGRLLSITARLTSNEYESQQISNAKMRLSTQSEEASTEYIEALNSQQFQYMTYDSKGNQVNQTLTVGSLYQYSDMKNQYLIINSAGQALISSEEAKNFEESKTLDEFLSKYGITKQWKSESLKSNYEILQSEEFTTAQQAYDDEKHKYEVAKYDTTTGQIADSSTDPKNIISSEQQWKNEQALVSEEYRETLAAYQDAVAKSNSGIDIDVSTYLTKVNAAKAKYTSCVNYDNWLSARASYEYGGVTNATDPDTGETYIASYNYNFNKISDVCKNLSQYDDTIAEFNTEAADYGTNMEDLFEYDDAAKAQWYTNLWYKLNGDSTSKSSAGEKGQNYTQIDSKLLSSTSWLQDAIIQGAVTIEMASSSNCSTKINEDNPAITNLTGISWESKIYSSCSDITQSDDDQAIAKAEAEYEKKTQEISAKDEKYQNKIKNLETEHSALQTEYESVQSAMNKNIERSFKVFS